ncbi:hypothetical protein [Desulforhopalus sp. IMCC35007]|uniref:hypothetical protein n=1 Tax=Desulforhopalus sp. IMCC35007 TaxID=2569543 RepID=UPI00197ACAA7|nr:hypothetical protein [Desulforhopalus sp. IMCC35007]
MPIVFEAPDYYSTMNVTACYSCGHRETCQVAIPLMMHGPDVKITEDIIPDVIRQPEDMDVAVEAGRLLGERLRNGHSRDEVTGKMQEKMMVMFQDAV